MDLCMISIANTDHSHNHVLQASVWSLMSVHAMGINTVLYHSMGRLALGSSTDINMASGTTHSMRTNMVPGGSQVHEHQHGLLWELKP